MSDALERSIAVAAGADKGARQRSSSSGWALAVPDVFTVVEEWVLHVRAACLEVTLLIVL